MKRLIGTTGRMVRRRWAALDGLAILTLARDRYAETPGEEILLHLGGRTQYRAAAAILDEFDRAALGDFYAAPAGFDPLGLTESALTADPGDDGLVIHSLELPRDQWAEATIPALAHNGDAVTVGLAIRSGAADVSAVDGYRAQVVVADGSPTLTRLVRVEAGTPTTLAEAEDPWAPGDVLRVVAEWNRLRVYRSGIMVLEHVDTDAPLLNTRHVGLQVVRTGAAVGTLTDFVAGAARQEYVGLLADRGDVSMSLGLLEPTATPASFTLTVVNCAPVGGAERFAALIRHGANDA